MPTKVENSSQLSPGALRCRTAGTGRRGNHRFPDPDNRDNVPLEVTHEVKGVVKEFRSAVYCERGCGVREITTWEVIDGYRMYVVGRKLDYRDAEDYLKASAAVVFDVDEMRADKLTVLWGPRLKLKDTRKTKK